jgi:DNA helicase-2/ATP-dependent DNA helicase PcrA
VRLEKNYRSTEPILDAAHSIISNNSTRKEKELWTDREEGTEPTVHAADSDYDEAEFVVDTIQMLEKIKGITPGDCAIFFRMNAQTRVFEEVFNRENIPYEIVSGVGFYERKEIKDLMAYLSILVNPDDDQSLRRIINTPSRGIGGKTLESLELVAESEGVSLVEALRLIDDREEVSGRARSSLESFRDLYESLCEVREGKPKEVIEAVLDETNYVEEEYSSEDTERRESRRENLEELKRVAETFQNETAEADLAKFLEEATLLQDVDTLEEETQRVKMMTLHAAKGLEFPVVFMAGMEEGLLPHQNSEYDEERREEERRLCYVGFTRAQDRLYCTWTRSRYMYGREQTNRPSRFLKEAGLLDQSTSSSDPFESSQSTTPKDDASSPFSSPQPETSSQTPGMKDGSSNDVPDLRPGDTVKHPKFGEGRIMEISGSESSPIAKIDFDSVGIKQLALSFARLESV